MNAAHLSWIKNGPISAYWKGRVNVIVYNQIWGKTKNMTDMEEHQRNLYIEVNNLSQNAVMIIAGAVKYP